MTAGGSCDTWNLKWKFAYHANAEWSKWSQAPWFGSFLRNTSDICILYWLMLIRSVAFKGRKRAHTRLRCTSTMLASLPLNDWPSVKWQFDNLTIWQPYSNSHWSHFGPEFRTAIASMRAANFFHQYLSNGTEYMHAKYNWFSWNFKYLSCRIRWTTRTA